MLNIFFVIQKASLKNSYFTITLLFDQLSLHHFVKFNKIIVLTEFRMKKNVVNLFFFSFLFAFLLLAQIPPTEKDSDVFNEFEKAKSLAKKENKRILVLVGGDWCDWCTKFDSFINNDKELIEIINKNYVVLKVYSKNDLSPNGLFLAKFPSPSEFPFIYILNSDGKLLESKKNSLFEKGESYDKIKIKQFLEYWAKKN